MSTTRRRGWRALRIAGCLAGCAGGTLLGAQPAAAVAPLNDNYLASTPMMRSDATVLREYHNVIDTSEATVQPDLFQPDREGMPLGGGPGENTACAQSQFGATVWYDFLPEISGGAQVLATGYDTVVSVYEYDVQTARITRTVTCSNRPGAGEDVLLPRVKRGLAYTVQVGRVGPPSGMLDFTFNFFGDRDEDDVLDAAPDRCPDIRGVSEAGGCPPRLRTSPRVRTQGAGNGVRVISVSLAGVPRGARVEARCRRCGLTQVRQARTPVVGLSRFAGRTLPNGAVLELLVTRKRSGSGRFKFGAIGDYYRYVIRRNSLGPRTERCLKPGSTTPRTRCT